MIQNDFIGGDDVQRSLTHSDNRCVNLIPALNDKGDIAAFYGTPGLTLEYTNPSDAVGSGIYTASNGRAFEVAGTTLYELIDTAGVISTTIRGTVTSASIYRMTDNGIEMLLVNGTDGWLFTFATNTLAKIKVATDTFTVTIADPAVFTQSAHGLVAGDAIRLNSTTGDILSDTVLSALSPATVSTTHITVDIVVSPNNQFVYACSPDNLVYCFNRNTSSGLISPFSPPTVTSTGLNQKLIMSSDGISLYVSEPWNNQIWVFSANTSTGALTHVYTTTVLAGSFTVGMVLHPDDTYLYAVNPSYIYQYSRNAGTGELSALTPASVATGTTGSGEIVISDDGNFAYVSQATDNIIQLYSISVSGLLTYVSSVSCEGLLPVDLALSPETNNPFLYVLNHGTNEIEVFSRNSTTGAITHVAASSISTGTMPATIICTAESVYVTNMNSNTVSMFIRDTSSGKLTATTTPTIATGGTPTGMAIAPDGNSVYVCNTGDSTISQYDRNGTSSSIGLPAGLEELTTYYVISAGLTADNFEVSETLGGTAVSTSGQQAGVHTYTTLGYGFPEGAKTCAYMNGRFIACEPNTQNFYVSEVLDGKWWDALNVQTVDSNPDYVIGEIVSHNELIVFCEGSGEVFYDSGTTPSPFVRNTSGIFEVGCAAPYSICNLDNQIFWLGGTKNGKGIVYKMQGLTPVRISTHSIEYSIQSMTTISDARAFSYQQEGHHYYVITFPTGNKTYCFDVNTGLWHERAAWSGSAFSRWAVQEHAYFAGKHLALSYSDGKIFSIDNDVHKNGTDMLKWVRSFSASKVNMDRVRHNRLILECEVGTGTGTITGGSVSSVTMTNAGASSKVLSFASQTMPSNQPWSGVAWNGTVFCAIQSGTVADIATSPDGITWTARSLPTAAALYGIAWNGDVFCAVGGIVGVSGGFTSPDGITWTQRTLPSTPGGVWTCITYGNKLFVIGNSGSTPYLATSPDGINWTPKTIATGGHASIAWSGTQFCLICNGNGAGSNAAFTSPDGTTWTPRTLLASVEWRGVAWNGTVFCAVADNSIIASRVDTSADGITWVNRTILASQTWNGIAYGGGLLVIINNSGAHYISSDGITWTATTGSGITLNAIVWNGTIFSGVGTSAACSVGISGYVGGTYALTFTGGAPSVAATGTYTISSTTGQITSTSITNNGSGYTSAPTIAFNYGGITGAVGVANMNYTYGTPTVSMRFSDDRGKTWSTPRTESMGTTGENPRVIWRRLGMDKWNPRIYEFSGTDDAQTVLINAHLE